MKISEFAALRRGDDGLWLVEHDGATSAVADEIRLALPLLQLEPIDVENGDLQGFPIESLVRFALDHGMPFWIERAVVWLERNMRVVSVLHDELVGASARLRQSDQRVRHRIQKLLNSTPK